MECAVETRQLINGFMGSGMTGKELLEFVMDKHKRAMATKA
jgi:hypothetical protein